MEDLNVYVTSHAKMRARQRFKWSYNRIKQIVQESDDVQFMTIGSTGKVFKDGVVLVVERKSETSVVVITIRFRKWNE